LKVKYSRETHGTHCISIAAGSVMEDVKGISGESLGGIAPESDILICDVTSDGAHREDMWKMGYDVGAMNISQSIQFMQDQARKQQKPLVVSMSLNSHDGWHDGTSNMAYLLGNYCREDGLALMLCTGNEGGEDTYLNRTVARRDTLHIGFFPTIDSQASSFCCMKTNKRVRMRLSLYDRIAKKELYRIPTMVESDDESNLEFYYDMADEDSDGLTLKERLVYKNLKKYMKEGLIYAACYKSLAYDQNEQEYECTYAEIIHQDIVWNDEENAYDENGKFRYSFMLHLIPSEETELHAWGDYYELFYIDESGNVVWGSPDVSMGDWNTSGEQVSVGAWVANNQVQAEGSDPISTSDEVGSISWFSSYGTDLAGHKHPDVCAPGSNVCAAFSSFMNEEDYRVYVHNDYTDQFVGQTTPRSYAWGWLSGTSMATPAVAGVVALWMQAAADKGKTLTCADIKDIIAHSSDTDGYTEEQPQRFGHGKVNAYKGLLYVLGLETAIEGLSKDQPEDVSFRVAGDLLYADGAEDGTTVTLYNLSGVLVRQTVVQGGAISLSGLQQGVYAVQLGRLGSTLIRK